MPAMLPRLNHLAIAAPPYVLDGDTVMQIGRRVFGEALDRLGPVHANAGVDKRHSCVPAQWYLHPHGWTERNELYAANALRLATRVSLDVLKQARLTPDAVDAVVTVSTTGICTPSLDALLMEELGMRPDVVRLPVFGLGCAGGVLGLARAAALAAAMPGAIILLVVVELCGLTFRAQDRSPANMVATALFGDGAAAALVSTQGDGAVVAGSGEHTWPDTLDVMGWRVADDGLGVQFSRDIPHLVETRLRPALDEWLDRQGLVRADIAHWACHPGGTKVVAALERALTLPAGHLKAERDVLRRYGNMSAATVLFVLAHPACRNRRGRTVALALGPGFTAGFLLLRT